MARTAQKGLGPRTVALSLKVFIVVMFLSHERRLCTAQPLSLPKPLMDNLQEMREHFCNDERTQCNRPGPCGMRNSSRLCPRICNSICPTTCWNTSEAPECPRNQIRVCGYRDATVCQFENSRRGGTCVYRRGSSPPFCICRNQETSVDRCRRTDPDPTTEQSNTASIVLDSLFALLLLLVIIGAVIVYLRRRGRLPSFCKRSRAKPAELPSVQLETRNATRAKLPHLPVPGGSMEYSYAHDHQPAKPGAQEDPDQDDHIYYSVGEGEYRQGNPRYVLDGQRKIPATKELDKSTDDAKDHPYFVLNRDEDGDEVTDSSTGVKHNEVDDDYTPLVPTGDPKSRSEQPGKEVNVSPTLAKGSDVGISNADDGNYFPLVQAAATTSPVKQSGYEEEKIPISTSPIEVQPSSYDNNTYTPLDQGPASKSPVKQSGYEDAKIPISTSPSEVQPSNYDDNTYTPLVQAAAPMSPVKQSGYEDAKIPTSTSPSEVQPSNCDDDTYTPLALTVEPKSQNEHSGYEAATILKPGSAAITDDISPYDHLHRQEEKESREGAFSTVDVDDYQHLVNN
ncbi:uncharacterized protein [Asterias amurensis]|uniref:uncharacterized protein isoform X2 n=1 Tax=Asterias amurensis TaxID=7602 RepID=UPI003AB23CA1